MKLQTIPNWAKKNWHHLIIWLVVILNFFFAPAIYSQFFLKQGNSISSNDSLPAATDQGKIYIDGLDPILINGENLYKLWGWAFLSIDKELSPEDYTRTVILESDEKIYEFSVINVSRKGVQEFFKDLNVDIVSSGFYSNISKETLSPGVYRISVLFERPDGSSYLLRSANMIERTTNSISLR